VAEEPGLLADLREHRRLHLSRDPYVVVRPPSPMPTIAAPASPTSTITAPARNNVAAMANDRWAAISVECPNATGTYYSYSAKPGVCLPLFPLVSSCTSPQPCVGLMRIRASTAKCIRSHHPARSG
jgi:soluble lytic murein transglycosylase-like protein